MLRQTSLDISQSPAHLVGLAHPLVAQVSISDNRYEAYVADHIIVQNSLLIVAYPSGDAITTSLRQADEYANPHLINGTDAAVHPIASGTFVNETSYTITFMCTDCILTDGRTFYPNATQPVLGYATSFVPIADPKSTNSTLNFHSTYGNRYFNTEYAISAYFDEWASQASITSEPNPKSKGIR